MSRTEKMRRQYPLTLLLIGLVALTVAVQGQNAGGQVPPSALSVDEVVHRLEASNQARNAALRSFEGVRTYTLHYHGFPSQSAELVVALDYQAPSTKNFKIVSQSGSKFILDHVLKKMIESEREAAQDQSRNSLSSSNYSFSLAGFEQLPEGNCYVLNVSPKTKNKFLYRGKAWVNATDFAVVKIEAEPAQNPSFFISRTEVHHRYEKVNSFWLPAENRTTSYLRIGGHADLSIEYQQYKITASDPIHTPATAASNGGTPTETARQLVSPTE